MARSKKRKVVTHVHIPTPRTPPTPLQYRGYRATLIARTTSTLIRWSGAVGIAVMAYFSVRVLAGQTTIAVADVLVNVIGNIKVNQWAAWLLAVGTLGYGWRERRLRHKVNEKLGDRIGQLEQQIDRRRTSSKLTKTGQTDPEDSV